MNRVTEVKRQLQEARKIARRFEDEGREREAFEVGVDIGYLEVALEVAKRKARIDRLMKW